MLVGDGLGHLAYSTLVHPGDTWEQMRASVEKFAPAVKARVSPTAPYGLSLRISAASAQTLHADPEERARFRQWLDDHDMYVFTVNAFPYGSFKGSNVMERVYEPDWSTVDRVRYTKQVADILTDISPAWVAPSIQTAPLAFRTTVIGDERVRLLTENLLRVVAHLVALERRTGRRIKLGVEPEPFCYLETTEETVRYFEEHIWSADGIRCLMRLSGLPSSEVAGLARRHLGVVFDVCHQAVQFEDIAGSLRLLRDSGLPIFKLQAAAALRVPQVTPAAVQALDPFTRTIYLSQTTESRDGRLTRMLNLADAIEAWHTGASAGGEWRTHFHLPVFLDELGELRTTRPEIETALAMHARTPLSDHLEIETYTWDVLPEHLKSGDITEYVSRELDWARGVLSAAALS
jgi:hypothetical protein